MVPLQTIFLLLLIITSQVTALDGSAATQAASSAATAPAFRGAAWVIVSLALSHLFLVALLWQRTASAVRLLYQTAADSSTIAWRVDRMLSMARWITLGLVAFHLYALHVRDMIQAGLANTVLLKHIPFFPDALITAPTLLAWLAFWAAGYRLESAVRQRSLPFRLAQGLPVHDMPSLGGYLSMQIRHNLFPVVPLLFYGVVTAAGDALLPRIPHADQIAGPLAVLLIAVFFPWLLTRVWTTAPLTGPLRQRLDAVALRYRLRFSNILLWKTHNVVTNAAILGYLPFARYFFMTDALLESLTDDQLEAVFAHEVGHGVHRHIPWYLAAFLGAMALGGAVLFVADYFLPPHLAGSNLLDQFLPLALVALFLALGFPFFSHRFEHQADWFAARHMACVLHERNASHPAASRTINVELHVSAVPTPVEQITLQEYARGQYPHAEPAASPPAAAMPSPSTTPPIAVSPAEAGNAADLRAGADIFNSALDALVELSHRARHRSGWMHPSPEQRISLLRRLAGDASAAHSFERKMRRTRLLIVALLVLGIGAAIAASFLDNGGQAPATQPAGPQTLVRLF